MLGVFVDSGDLYHRIKRRFNKKLSYEKYREKVHHLDNDPMFDDPIPIDQFIVYSTKETNNISFLHFLKALNIQTKRKRSRIIKNDIKICDWGVQLTLDVVDFIKENEDITIVLGISNLDYIPLIKWLQEKDIKVIVFACSIPDRIKEICECIEIEEELCN